MKSRWEKVKLGSVIELVYGKPLPEDYRKRDGLYPVYGANGEIARTDQFYYDEESIIVGRKGSAGEINLTEKRFWPLDVTYYVAFDHNKYDLMFLYYLLEVQELPKMAKGVKPGINRNEVYDLDVNIPDLPEQQRIVAILDQVIGAIETAKTNTEKNLKNIVELFEIYLQGISAEKASLRDLVEIKTGKLDANAAKPDGKYPFFTCAREVYSIDKYAFDCEAILLAGNNAVGDFNVKHYMGKFNAYQRTYVITVNQDNKVLYRYLYFQLLDKLKEFKVQAVGAGTKFLKLGMIQDMEIPLPSLEDQVEIVAKLDILESVTKKLGDLYRQKLFGLEDLKKSILQKAFNGEL